MTTNLVTCPSSATIADAARLMRDRNIGDVLVTRDGDKLAGIVTEPRSGGALPRRRRRR